jgi:hypothetical protein
VFTLTGVLGSFDDRSPLLRSGRRSSALDANELTVALAVLRVVPAPEFGPPIDPHRELNGEVRHLAATFRIRPRLGSPMNVSIS